MSGGFQAGYYTFRPANAPTGSNISTGSSGCTCPPLPPDIFLTVDKNAEVWQVTGDNDKFNLLSKPIPEDQYKWIARDDVLFGTLNNEAGTFKIDSAGQGLWHIGIPDQNILLTYVEGSPQLTFKAANGSLGQTFVATPSDGSAMKKKKKFF